MPGGRALSLHFGDTSILMVTPRRLVLHERGAQPVPRAVRFAAQLVEALGWVWWNIRTASAKIILGCPDPMPAALRRHGRDALDLRHDGSGPVQHRPATLAPPGQALADEERRTGGTGETAPEAEQEPDQGPSPG